MTTHNTRSSDEIRREIEATRNDVDRTLNEIQGRFTPGQLLDQGLDYVRHSGANEFVQNLGRSVKYNPLPVTLVGIGLTWLMVTGGRNGSGSGYSSQSSMRDKLGDLSDEAGAKLGDVGDEVRAKLDEGKGRLSSAAQDVRERATQAKQTLSGTVQSARDRLSKTAQGARQQVYRAREGYDWMVQEHPLALGAIGVAVGALLAGAAPRTRIEDEVMGEKRDELVDRATEAASEKLDEVRDTQSSDTQSSVTQPSATQPFDSQPESERPFQPPYSSEPPAADRNAA